MTVPPGLHAFCRLALQARVTGRSKMQHRVLLPSSAGITRVDMLERMRLCWGITWTMAQLVAVLDALRVLGAVKCTGLGYRAVNWDLIEGLVADRVQPDVGEEVPA